MDEKHALTLLAEGELEIDGRVTWGSNYTFLGRACLEEQDDMIVYKPRRGERPLWDFASGTLCLREHAAYLVSKALNWNIVPPTVLREGPSGLGSVQLFIDHDPNVHYFNLQGLEAHETQLQQIVLFDLISNNADRKAGHVLVDGNDRLWTIDHGLCFHEEYKLRTVIWDFAGMPVPDVFISDLQKLQGAIEQPELKEQLLTLLSVPEVSMLQKRIADVVQLGRFPEPGPGRHYPWPPV